MIKLRTLLLEDVDSLSKLLIKKYQLKSLVLGEFRNIIRLKSIIVDKTNRNFGIGTRVMEELCDYADRNKKTITLTPAVRDDYQGTTSQSRLINFYKRFGFVLNKGRNKDFTISDLMYRNPQ